ncbi:MAG: type II toxin-antitoxin system PemK/MazF family toxin [Acidobacteria bacterium]|nr:type II toxin-antitoxin system PemK/MazF family toxin [Acidobacteriota bacterium]
MTRGDIVVVATRGAYTSKPRPALVVQSDAFNPTHASITICPVTSECVDAPLFRILLPAGKRTGLTAASQVMVDKVVSVPRDAVDRTIGRVDSAELQSVGRALADWLSL